MATVPDRLDVEPKEAFFCGRQLHKAGTFATYQIVAVYIWPRLEEVDRAALTKHYFIAYRRHGEVSRERLAMARQYHARNAHRSQRTFHVAHTKAVKSPLPARQLEDWH